MSAQLTSQMYQQLINRQSSDKDGTKENHSFCKTLAPRIAPESGDLVKNAAPLIAEGTIEDMTDFLETQRSRLKALARANLERDRKTDQFYEALKQMKAEAVQSSQQEAKVPSIDAAEKYQKRIEEIMAQIHAAAPPTDIKNQTYYREILQALGEDTGTGQDDDDICVMPGQQEISLKCPISTALLKEPVKAKRCGHVFSKASILGLLERKHSIVCPISGCSNKQLTRGDLEDDKTMETFVRRERKRLERSEKLQASQAQSVDSDEE